MQPNQTRWNLPPRSHHVDYRHRLKREHLIKQLESGEASNDKESGEAFNGKETRETKRACEPIGNHQSSRSRAPTTFASSHHPKRTLTIVDPVEKTKEDLGCTHHIQPFSSNT
ncbi:unnamed protein product [Brassica rapa]|uniref:Uncharacterized protein n=2 Tax=Brassica TaxID=3705 RepID=A0A3P6BB30_BRACM|nr:unnamed protein product [Brassica napus]CAG7902320.1 unnamed protein product [Brassica rapa]VDC98379.1 unnamed protein product [Brassica rapa]